MPQPAADAVRPRDPRLSAHRTAPPHPTVIPRSPGSVPPPGALLAATTAAATWVLLLIGGTVNPTGSSLACPDWVFLPTCHGQLFPEMTGGVLFEHGHRLWATLVGLLTLGLGWRAFRRGGSWRTWGLVAAFLVALQGTLGGLTVLVGLDPALSTLHLLLGYGFFTLVTALAVRWRAAPAPARAPSTWALAAVLAAVTQVALGGALRHLGGGLVCGTDWLGCAGGGLWPGHGLLQMHMLHRLVGYALVPLVVVAVWRASTAGRHPLLTWAPALLVLVQVALGLLTVATGRQLALVTFHTGVGALLVASLTLLALPSRARAVRTET